MPRPVFKTRTRCHFRSCGVDTADRIARALAKNCLSSLQNQSIVGMFFPRSSSDT